MNDTQAIFSSEFRDFDAFAEAIEDADLRFTLPRCETSLWQVTGVYLIGWRAPTGCKNGQWKYRSGMYPG